MEKRNTTLNKHILITFSHAERRSVNPKNIIERFTSRFSCEAVVVAKENHKEKGCYHYHVGMKAHDASRYTAAKFIRATFPEFDGMQCNVEYRKGWGPICKYITKEDKDPLVWDEITKEEVLAVADATKKKKRVHGLD